jgi:hypothetical protein
VARLQVEGDAVSKKLQGMLPQLLHWLEVLVAGLAIVFVAIGIATLLMDIGGV